ncbi:MAG: LacI family transcriptional regulator, fructose operon transcriptional repressor, partial [Caballeronia sp.]|nr:LacI family transcriptional regulator, fructose operon transcriptional repressor [Caballeronia sp.]
QDVDKIISEAFALADNHDTAATHPLVVVPTGFGDVMDEDDQAVKHQYDR